jgi:hypothetical protein
MKILLALLISFAGSLSFAQVLGELHGDAAMTWNIGRLDGSSESRKVNCHVAMNVLQSSEHFGLNYSLYNCEQYGPWNDPVIDFKIVGSHLVDAAGNIRGEVLPDGSFKFAWKTSQVYSYNSEVRDFTCRVVSWKKKTVSLDSIENFVFKKVDGGGYLIQREASQDQIAWTSHRDSKFCPVSMIPAKTTWTSSMQFKVH